MRATCHFLVGFVVFFLGRTKIAQRMKYKGPEEYIALTYSIMSLYKATIRSSTSS